MVFLKEIFENVSFEEKKSADDKKSMQEDSEYLAYKCVGLAYCEIFCGPDYRWTKHIQRETTGIVKMNRLTKGDN